MGAELAALPWIEAALEQGAKDARVDRAPVERGSVAQRSHIQRAQARHLGALEQAAVEPRDAVGTEEATVAHRREEALQAAPQDLGLGRAVADQALEDALGQQAHVFGEEAEEALGQQVRGHVGRHTGGAQSLGRGREGVRRFLGDLPIGAPGLEAFGRAEAAPQQLALGRVAELFEPHHMALAGRAVEVGVNLDAQAVADDQQRRVVERERVRHQLAQCGVERLAGGLVLPCEVAALEDIGVAAAPARLGVETQHAFLEHIVVAALGRGCAEHGAEFDEVLLRALLFVERVSRAAWAPTGDEVVGGGGWGGHGCMVREAPGASR